MTDSLKCLREFGVWESSHTGGGSINWYSLFGNYLALSVKTEHSHTTPGFASNKNLWTYAPRDIYKDIYRLFIQQYKQTKCPSIVELQMDELWHIHTIESYTEMEMRKLYPYTMAESYKYNIEQRNKYTQNHTGWFPLYKFQTPGKLNSTFRNACLSSQSIKKKQRCYYSS